MSYAKITSAQPYLLEGHLVTIEVDLARGLHSFSIVGLAHKSVEEAKDRISSAIKNSGYESPKAKNHKIVISLSPADMRKEGTYFDLGMALGYLLASKAIVFEPEGKVFLGELTLSGILMPVRGILALAEAARNDGCNELYVPHENASEAALVAGIKVYGVTTLSETIDNLIGKSKTQLQPIHSQIPTKTTRENTIDMQEIRGQETAKRGLEIAAAGGHNIAFVGPPGTGKTLLARAFTSILPELTLDEILETTRIHSITGASSGTLITHPPLRSPHHTASYTAMIGGGTFPRPGEVTLAHRGVLFLDEFPEFDKRVVESLRQPLEDNIVSVARSHGSASFPSNFILVAAMNPCPCGYRGARTRKCTCAPHDIERYNRKLSGPIVDRIDIWITVPQIEYEKLLGTTHLGETSETIRTRVCRARERAAKRFKQHTEMISRNADMRGHDIQKYISLTPEITTLLQTSAEKLQLSGRAYHRVIKLAQTIADLAGSENIESTHVLEALQYRPKM